MGKEPLRQEQAHDVPDSWEGLSGAESQDKGVASGVRREVPGLASSVLEVWWVFGWWNALFFKKEHFYL